MSDSALRGVRELYDRDADMYATLRAEWLRTAGARAIAGLDLGSARVVFDVACGTGTGLAELRRRTADAVVAGVDLSTAMLRYVDGDFRVAQADAARLPFADAVADAIVCCFALMHMTSPLAAVAEFYRVLRPGGAVALTTWGPDVAWPARDRVLAILDELGAPNVASSHHGGAQTDSAEKVTALLRAAGFCDIAVETARVAPLERDVETAFRSLISLGSPASRVRALNDELRQEFFSRARDVLADYDVEDLAEPRYAVFAWGRVPGTPEKLQ